MNGTLDDIYLTWLYSQVGDVKARNKSHTYWNLFRQMHTTEFLWLVPNDDNRVEDGRALRTEWAEDFGYSVHDVDWAFACSFLEMLIGISRRLAFEGDGHTSTWFWHLISNLGLQTCTDDIPYDEVEVDFRINAVTFRTYDRNGRGGLFPLKNARQHQRNVELWYQMQAYLQEA